MIKTKRIMTAEVLGEKQDQKGSQAGSRFFPFTDSTDRGLTDVCYCQFIV